LAESATEAILDQHNYEHGKPAQYIKNAIETAETIEDAVKLFSLFGNCDITKILAITDDNVAYQSTSVELL